METIEEVRHARSGILVEVFQTINVVIIFLPPNMISGTVASSSSVTTRVLAKISIESHIEIPTHNGFICG